MYSLEGFHAKHATFGVEDGSTLAPGQLVQVTGDNTVDKAASGGFAGVVVSARGRSALVQITGFARIKLGESDLTALPYGCTSLAAAAGGLGKAGAGRTVIVTDKNMDTGTAGVILL